MPFALRHAVLVCLLALPWLWPFTFGPTAAVLPYLSSALLAALALLIWPGPDNGRTVQSVAWAWLAAALVSSVIALLQYFDLETPLFPWVNIAQPGQAFGNLRQPNQLATLLVMGLMALRWLRTQQALAHKLAWVLAALQLVALAAAASRTGLVELAAVAVLALWWAWRSGARLWPVALGAVAALACFALAAVVLPWALQGSEGLAGRDLVERLQHGESTCGSRLILWSNVLDLIGQKPWTGWGWGELAYAHYITLYDGPRFCHILDNAHNLPLHLAVELGVPAAVLICGALFWLVWRGRPWAEADATRQLAWGVLLAIGLHSLVEYPLWYGPFQIAAALCVWMLCTTPARAAQASARWRTLRWTVAGVMLAAVAYAGWDYHRVSQIYLPVDERAARYQDDAMAHAQRSWLFAGVVRFAEVTTRPVTRENAAWMLPAALATLHDSPEPRVITKVIESATMLGQDDLALRHLARFRAAFAAQHRAWAEENLRALRGAQARLAAARASAASAAR